VISDTARDCAKVCAACYIRTACKSSELSRDLDLIVKILGRHSCKREIPFLNYRLLCIE